MNNEKQFCVVLLTILLQHVVSSPTPSHYHRGLITKRTTASASLTKLSSSSWPPKLPSYDIWGSGGIIKKNSSISKNITSLSSSVSTSASSVSHIINGNDIDDEGNMVYVDEKEILGRRRNGKGNWKIIIHFYYFHIRELLEAFFFYFDGFIFFTVFFWLINLWDLITARVTNWIWYLRKKYIY